MFLTGCWISYEKYIQSSFIHVSWDIETLLYPKWVPIVVSGNPTATA